MPVLAALRALASCGVFASRAFAPLFVLAAIARWPALVAWLPLGPDPPLVLPDGLAWLASDPALAALAALSILELASERGAEARELLDAVVVLLLLGSGVPVLSAVLAPAIVLVVHAVAARARAAAA